MSKEAFQGRKVGAGRRSRRKVPGFKIRMLGGYDETQVLEYLSALQDHLEKEYEGYEQRIREQDKKLEELRTAAGHGNSISDNGMEGEGAGMLQGGILAAVLFFHLYMGWGEGRLQDIIANLSHRIDLEHGRLNIRRRHRRFLWLTAVLLLLSGLTAVLFVTAGIDRVEGDSMYPSLQAGDVILYSRKDTDIKRGDIIVFTQPGTRGHTVKRVAGLPGDTVSVDQDGRIIVNGRMVREPYVTIPDRGWNESAPLTVMDGHYFVLGDNRGESLDSRYSQVGTVKKEDILGKVTMIVRRNRSQRQEKEDR